MSYRCDCDKQSLISGTYAKKCFQSRQQKKNIICFHVDARVRYIFSYLWLVSFTNYVTTYNKFVPRIGEHQKRCQNMSCITILMFRGFTFIL